MLLPLPDLKSPHSAYQDDEPLRRVFSEGGGGGESFGRLELKLAIDLRFGSHVMPFELDVELRLRFELSGELVDFSLTAKMPESTSTESVT